MKPEPPLPIPLRYLEGRDNRKTDVVVVVPVARCEWHLAIKLLKWMTMLGHGDYPLVVFCAPKLSGTEAEALVPASGGKATLARANFKDTGYYGGANRMFKGALDYCEQHHPGKMMLWIETDAVPMRSFWVEDILDEYRGCGQPFMGDIHLCAVNHMTGNGCWAPEWRTIAPSLAALPAPDPEWGWDTMCADDTFPRCHRAKTIQQVWRPQLPITLEWHDANIRVGTVLFHQVKDGSLIDVLCRMQGRSLIPDLKALEESSYAKGRQTPSPFEKRLSPQQKHIAGIPERPRNRIPIGDIKTEAMAGVAIMVVSYKKEIEFLKYCLKAIDKYASGFCEVVVCVPEQERGSFDWIRRARVVYFEEQPGKGMLSHMIMKCRADEICPTANAIVHLDSDTMLWQNCTPVDFTPNGKCVMVRERYADIKNPNRLLWQKNVERALGFKPEYETMVRQGNCYPRAVYGVMRSMVEKFTKQPFDQYVLSGQNQFPQSFCEFDTLGAVAIAHFRDQMDCRDYDKERDSRECGVPIGSWQYIYRRDRDVMVETWGHGGIGMYKSDIEAWLRGQVPAYFVK